MIQYGSHSTNGEDIEEVARVLRGDYLTTGPMVEAFEQRLEARVGAPCISVSSGTAALHCAYASIDLQPGDEIITPPITFIATQATAASFGAKIVFADVQLDTGNINPEAVESAITSRTKAIVAVDYAGHPADLQELRSIADKYKLFLIEDAAHSLGSTYRDKAVGSIADITTFSFFPTKNITTGEGGAVASTDPALLERVRKFSRQGLVREAQNFVIVDQGPWHQEVQEFGLNYRLPDILCALGYSQLKRIDEFKLKRNQIFEKYNFELSKTHEVTVPTKREYVNPMWHLYPIKVDKKSRLKLFNYLRSQQIWVQVNYMPAYWHPVFAELGFRRGQFPVADSFYESEISLPMHVELSESQISKVADVIREFFK
jgi:dTDP-4-amino-4,6-dideoxygalactose transaminase